MAAVANPEGETVRPREEGSEVVIELAVEEYRLGPALSCAQHIAIGEAAAGGKPGELRQAHAARLQVGHMHVVTVEACALKCGRHFHVAVNALLAQYRDLRLGARDKARGSQFVGGESQLRRQTRIAGVLQTIEFFLGTIRIVAQARDVIPGLGPGAVQFDALCREGKPCIAPDAYFVIVVGLADEMGHAAEIGGAQHVHHLHALVSADLQHRTQFLAEEHGEQAIEQPAIEEFGSAFQPVDVVHQRVVAQGVDIERNAAMRRERHLADGGEQAAVRTIVIREDQAGFVEPLDCRKETTKHVGIRIRRRTGGERRKHLGQRGAAQAILACAQIDQQQFGLACVTNQLRGEAPTHVGAGRESGDDQGQRRDHLLGLAVLAP